MKLGDSEVHIWQVNLDEVQLHLLSADEQVRADRFKFEQHRNRFVAGRSFLRSLLSQYLQTDPLSLTFEYSPHGKPTLTQSRIQFNLAHSQHLALYAVTYDRAVGIDLEAIRPVEDLESLVQRFFLPSEYRAIQADHALFFQYWTCKEAFLKAIGTGLSKLKELEIENAQLKVIPAEARSQNWHLQPLAIHDDFAAAIVIEQNCPSLDLQSFTPKNFPKSLPHPE
ncbi:MAG: 4'-phosphopantetheinyl transferase superfamily protein [Leptolyngbya sp. Prado105]|jgi:4'-phosphopantetheinyl transferase|nr:4'-phosphopantetheinyl transferase superfamily protein [Leptolyngbya sp. Prado105]